MRSWVRTAGELWQNHDFLKISAGDPSDARTPSRPHVEEQAIGNP
jgi:hypothetical protein